MQQKIGKPQEKSNKKTKLIRIGILFCSYNSTPARLNYRWFVSSTLFALFWGAATLVALFFDSVSQVASAPAECSLATSTAVSIACIQPKLEVEKGWLTISTSKDSTE
jgi:hypothetical protein